MAKKQADSKPELERVYNVPLRKEYQKSPRWRRTKKATIALREFLQKHMKSENVKISREVNEKLWQHGIRNPPHHIKVNVTKDREGVVRAELFGSKKTESKKENKKETKQKKPTPAAKQ